MASTKQKALAAKRKPAQMDDEKSMQDYKNEMDDDRYEDPNQPKNVNANTDDEGNPLATKDSVSMAKQKSAQTQSDYNEYEQKTALPKRIRDAAMAAKRKK